MGTGDAGALTGAVVVLVLVGFWVYCVLDFSRTDERDMRTFTRPLWIILLVFFNVFAGMMWLQLGRPQRPARGS